MKLKDRIKTYNFWVSLSSAIFLLLKVLGTQFGFKVDESLFSDLFTSLCGILVILGIIVPPSYKTNPTLAFDSNQINNLTKTEDVKDDEISPEINEEHNVDINQVDNDTDLNTEIMTETNSSINSFENLNDVIIDCEESSVNEKNTNIDDSFEFEQLIAQVEKTLLNQQHLLKDHKDLYVELLKNQIDMINNN